MVNQSHPASRRPESPAAACCAGSTLTRPGAGSRRAGLSQRLWRLCGGTRWVWLLLGLVAVTAVAVALGGVTGLAAERLRAEAWRNLAFVAEESWSILPYFLLSVGLSAWAQVSSFSARVKSAFAQREPLAVVAAAVVGATVPLCSCSVLPLIAGLLAGGVPLGPVMAFWLSAPLMSPAIFLVTAGTLGMPYAVARLVVALALGAGTGYVVSFLTARGRLRDPLRASALLQPSCCTTSMPQERERPGEPGVRTTFWTAFQRGALFLGKWLLLAFVLQALLVHYVDPAWIRALLGTDRALAIPLATAVGIPLYISGVAGIPLIQGLLTSGMAPGAALAFLVAGPVTAISALVSVWVLVKPRIFMIYLGAGVGGALAAGYIFQALAG